MTKLKIFVAGHKGMVGSSLLKFLEKDDVELITKNKSELNLLNQQDVQYFFKNQKIDQVYLAAARVGGIYANDTYPAEFIYQNLNIQTNVIHSAFMGGVKKLLFLGSSCIYPKYSNQPIKEEDLLTGKLEPTNEPYAIAKIAGIKMCESYNRQYGENYGVDFRCIMPTNLYGPGDNYHPENSHVVPALISRFHAAKINKSPSVTIWGTGKPKREFLYVDDMAKASIYLMNYEKKLFYKQIQPMCCHINIGSGYDLSINDLANKIKKTVGYEGKIVFDQNKPDGIKRKFLDTSKMNNLGFKSEVNLTDGLAKTYKDFIEVTKIK